jgi:hypothetical protein
VVYEDRLPTLILPPELNWIVDRGPPAWNESTRCFVTPDEKRRPIGILHLAGPAAKGRTYPVTTGDGRSIQLELRYFNVRDQLNVVNLEAGQRKVEVHVRAKR